MNACRPKISVCLPVWNGERYLEAAINSLLLQSFDEFELLISDDNSDDSSAQIAERFAKADKRVVILPRTERCGLFANYNRCLAASKAPILKFFAQDDLLHAEALATIYDTFQANPAVGLISVGKELIDKHGDRISGIDIPSVSKYFKQVDAKALDGISVANQILCSGENFIGEPAAVAIRKSAAGDGFDPSFTHVGDLEYWLRILLSSSMIYIKQKLYSFRIHDDSQSRRNRDGLFSMSDTLRMALKHEALCKSLNIDTGKQIREFVAGLAGQLFVNQLESPLSLENLRSRDKLLGELSRIPGQDLLKSMSSELLLFRELSYHALMTLGENSNRYRANREEAARILKREQQITVLECELGQLLSSVSWKTTRPLREFNSRLFGLQAKDPQLSRGIEDEEESLAAIAHRQESYLAYLQRLRADILASRSWKLTAPLRFLTGVPGLKQI